MECSGQRLHFLIFFSPFSNMRGKFLASLCLLNIGAFVYFVCRTDICAISIPRITNTSCTYCIRMKEERMKEKRKKSGMIVFNSQLQKKKITTMRHFTTRFVRSVRSDWCNVSHVLSIFLSFHVRGAGKKRAMWGRNIQFHLFRLYPCDLLDRRYLLQVVLYYMQHPMRLIKCLWMRSEALNAMKMKKKKQTHTHKNHAIRASEKWWETEKRIEIINA